MAVSYCYDFINQQQTKKSHYIVLNVLELYYSELHKTTENERVKYSKKVIIEMRFKQTTSELKAVDLIADCYMRSV